MNTWVRRLFWCLWSEVWHTANCAYTHLESLIKLYHLLCSKNMSTVKTTACCGPCGHFHILCNTGCWQFKGYFMIIVSSWKNHDSCHPLCLQLVLSLGHLKYQSFSAILYLKNWLFFSCFHCCLFFFFKCLWSPLRSINLKFTEVESRDINSFDLVW